MTTAFHYDQSTVPRIPAPPAAKLQGLPPGRVSADELTAEITRESRDFAAIINEYLEEHGIPRVALAKRMGVSPGRISQILSGGENVTVKTLASVAAALGVHFKLSID